LAFAGFDEGVAAYDHGDFVTPNVSISHWIIKHQTRFTEQPVAGGASIVDKFTTSGKALLEKDTKPESKPGQRRAAAYERLPS
jgi:hypothetical protein